MRVFLHNFAFIEKGVKCRGKKFTYPQCLKVRFPKLDSSLKTISALDKVEKYLDESWFNKQYFPTLG